MSLLKIILRIIYINLFLVFGIFTSSSQTIGDHEYQIKASYLFNLTQFVEWPDSALPTTNTALVIGILGENPFGSYLEDVVSGEVVGGHPLVIQQNKNVEEIKICHILFINLADPEELRLAIAGLKGQTILTVSDRSDFIQDGGMIRFMTRDSKILIQINPVPVKDVHLIISSKLL